MKFRNEYWFLSNMYPCRIKIGGNEFSCVESAFQSFKCSDKVERIKFVGIDGFESKKLGRRVKLISNWLDVREDVMMSLLLIKFKDKELMNKLRNIKGEIVEDNNWNDKFWGRCNGIGENKLGKMLMFIRDNK